jgi:putative transposase
MNTREIAAQFRLAHWAQIMQERVDCSQSIRAFCQAKGLSPNTYFYWQRKLRETAVNQMAAASQPVPSQPQVPSGWARVSSAQEAEPPRGLTLHIGAAKIEVRQGYDEALLASVIKTLSGLC